MRQHDFDFDTEDALSEEDVAHGSVNVFFGGVAAVDHQSVNEFHSLGSLASQLAGDNDFAALGAGLHDEAENAIAGSSHGETTDQLVAKRFSLSDGAKTTGGDLLSVKLDGTIGVVEALLHDGSQFADALAFVTQHILGARRKDDDLRARWSHAHLRGGS